MKRNDLNEAKLLDVKALQGRVSKLKQEVSDSVIDKNMNKMADKTSIRKKKIEIAQLMTILRQKQVLAMLEKGESNGR